MVKHRGQLSDLMRSFYDTPGLISLRVTRLRLAIKIEHGYRSIGTWTIWHCEWQDLYVDIWPRGQLRDVINLLAHHIILAEPCTERGLADYEPAGGRMFTVEDTLSLDARSGVALYLLVGRLLMTGSDYRARVAFGLK